MHTKSGVDSHLNPRAALCSGANWNAFARRRRSPISAERPLAVRDQITDADRALTEEDSASERTSRPMNALTDALPKPPESSFAHSLVAMNLTHCWNRTKYDNELTKDSPTANSKLEQKSHTQTRKRTNTVKREAN